MFLYPQNQRCIQLLAQVVGARAGPVAPDPPSLEALPPVSPSSSLLLPLALYSLAGASFSTFCTWAPVSFHSIDLQSARAALMGQRGPWLR